MDDQLKARVIALFEEVFRAGRAAERQSTNITLSEIAAALMRAQSADARSEGPSPHHGSDGEASMSPAVGGNNYPRKRAEPGAVIRRTEYYLRNATIPTTPLGIVEMAKANQETLNPSSVRMALQTLRDKGRARTAGHGRYEIVSSESAPPSGATPDPAPPIESREDHAQNETKF